MNNKDFYESLSPTDKRKQVIQLITGINEGVHKINELRRKFGGLVPQYNADLNTFLMRLDVALDILDLVTIDEGKDLEDN